MWGEGLLKMWPIEVIKRPLAQNDNALTKHERTIYRKDAVSERISPSAVFCFTPVISESTLR